MCKYINILILLIFKECFMIWYNSFIVKDNNLYVYVFIVVIKFSINYVMLFLWISVFSLFNNKIIF